MELIGTVATVYLKAVWAVTFALLLAGSFAHALADPTDDQTDKAIHAVLTVIVFAYLVWVVLW